MVGVWRELTLMVLPATLRARVAPEQARREGRPRPSWLEFGRNRSSNHQAWADRSNHQAGLTARPRSDCQRSQACASPRRARLISASSGDVAKRCAGAGMSNIVPYRAALSVALLPVQMPPEHRWLARATRISG